MYAALLRRDSEYDGVFFVAVKTTGIFCRPTCPARKPLAKNVRFFPNAADSLSAGYRPCKRCRPLEVSGRMPDWLQRLVDAFEKNGTRRFTDDDIAAHDVDPTRARRWFQANLGITFHRYLRARRLSAALAQLSLGDDLNRVAYDAGYESVSGFREAFAKTFGFTPGKAGGENAVLLNRILTPLGPMVVAADEQRLLLLEFADRRMLETQFQRLHRYVDAVFCPGENAVIEQTGRQLDEYFAGERTWFDLPLDYPGTDFQRRVWEALLKIPHGETRSYEQLGRSINKPNAARAVGRANGDNRLAIVVPCHRVICADGTLRGYGGGLRRKEWLLNLERGRESRRLHSQTVESTTGQAEKLKAEK